MATIQDYIETGIRKAGSKNALGHVIKTSSPNMDRVTRGHGHLGEDKIMLLAEFLGEDPEKLLLLNQLGKAPEESRALWADLLKKLTHAAAVAAVLVPLQGVFTAPAEASITPAPSSDPTAEIYIIRRRL